MASALRVSDATLSFDYFAVNRLDSFKPASDPKREAPAVLDIRVLLQSLCPPPSPPQKGSNSHLPLPPFCIASYPPPPLLFLL